MVYQVIAGMETVWKNQLVPIAFPESFARRFGQVVEINPVVVAGARIASKVLPAGQSVMILLWVEDVVRIVDVCPPGCRFRGGRINRQPDLPAPLEFRLVFVNVGQSVIVGGLQSSAGLATFRAAL